MRLRGCASSAGITVPRRSSPPLALGVYDNRGELQRNMQLIAPYYLFISATVRPLSRILANRATRDARKISRSRKIR